MIAISVWGRIVSLVIACPIGYPGSSCQAKYVWIIALLRCNDWKVVNLLISAFVTHSFANSKDLGSANYAQKSSNLPESWLFGINQNPSLGSSSIPLIIVPCWSGILGKL